MLVSIKGFTENIPKAFIQAQQDIDVYNNSWGDLLPLSELRYEEKLALLFGVNRGRHGLGNIFVFSAGNRKNVFYNNEFRDDEFNSNYVGFKNSRYTIAVAASTNTGKHSRYSYPGASVLINAPSNGGSWAITTTDRSDMEGYNPFRKTWELDYPNYNYTNSFGGTSSAAPLVSGIIALMLQANPQLTWRRYT